MSLGKKIYFSPIGYLISFAQHFICAFTKPMIVYGFYNRVQHKFYRSTRISSSAIISSKEKLDIGDNVWVNHYVRIDASGGVKIGEGCQIGFSSMILSHSSHVAIRLNGAEYIKQDISQRKGYIRKPVEIGDYTFIGGGSCIMPGVKIGKGCVIGVNSVVNRNVPDYTIVAGAPAKIIGSTKYTDHKYFNDSQVQNTYYDKSLINNYKKNEKNI